MKSAQKLRQRIAQCEEHKRTIRETLRRIKQEAAAGGQTSSEVQARTRAYLGSRTEKGWIELYDAHIREAEQELGSSNFAPWTIAAGFMVIAALLLSFALHTSTPTGMVSSIVQEEGDVLADAIASLPEGTHHLVVSEGPVRRRVNSSRASSLELAGEANLQLIVSRDLTLSSFETPLRLVDQEMAPHRRITTYNVLNAKALDKGFIVALPGTRISVGADDGETLEPIYRTDDFVAEWVGREGTLGEIRDLLDGAGAETRLEQAFPFHLLPSNGEEVEIYEYLHWSGTWATVKVEGPPRGFLLFLDPAGSWWDSGWQYRRNVTVQEQSGVNLTNYTLRMVLNSSNFNFSQARPNGEDVRFTYVNGSSEEALTGHFIESWNNATGNAVVWVMVPKLNASNSTTLDFYYGNPSANSTSNGSQAFLLFGNFSTGALINGWTSTVIASGGGGDAQGSVSVSGGNISLRNNFSNDVWTTIYEATVAWQNKTVNGNIEAITRVTTRDVPDAWAKAGIHLENSVAAAADNGKANMVVTGSNGYAFQYQAGGTEIAPDTNSNSGGAPSLPRYLRLVKQGTSVSGYQSADGTTWVQQGSTVSPSGIAASQYVTLFYTTHNAGSTTGTATFDQFYVRRYATANATYAIGQEEEGVLLNATFDLPANGTRVYRDESFVMNGTAGCEQGTCGNVSAWSQFLSTVSPTETWTESTQSEFASANSSVNITAHPTGWLQLMQQDGSIWWDQDWRYRLPINVTEQNGSDLSDFQVNITFDSATPIAAGNMNGQCQDIRITDANGSLLDHWMEGGCNTSSTIVWVQTALSASATATLYLYYGNTNATDASDINATMEQGLLAHYYNGTGIFTTLSGTCIDTSLNHAWGTGTISLSDCPNDRTDSVTIRWLGWILPGGSGNHSFHVTHDDGARVFVPTNNTIIDNWIDTAPIESSGSISFSTIQSLRWEWYENGGGAVAQLGWTPPGGSQTYPIPQSNVRTYKYVQARPTFAVGAEEQINFTGNGSYVSDAYDTGSPDNVLDKIFWGATISGGSTLTLYTRSSVDNSSWSSWFLEANNTTIDAPSRRYVQYRADFTTSNSNVTPRLEEMNIQYQFTTQGWVTMTPSTGLAATNPYPCDNLTGSCAVSWNVTPGQLGVFALRILANNTGYNATSGNSSVDVFARTSLIDLLSSPAIQARSQNILFSVRLLDDRSQPLPNRQLNFTDLTDNLSLGTNTTDAQGYAYFNWTVPMNATLGSHTLQIEFPENASAFLEGDVETLGFTVSSTPSIVDQQAAPSIAEIHEPVLLSANVSDAVGVQTVWVNVTRPDLSETMHLMSGSGNGTYTFLFNDTWQTGFYTFKVSANNTDGIVVDPPGNFTVNGTALVSAIPENETYRNFETVQLAHNKPVWWNESWPYRSNVTIVGTTSLLEEYQVDVTIDTASLVAAGKLNATCSDLRFVAEAGVNDSQLVSADYYLESSCNQTQTNITIQVPFIPAGENLTLSYYYGNPSASPISNLTETMSYSTPRTIGYLLNDNAYSTSVLAFSLEDNNNVTINGTSVVLDTRENATFGTPGFAAPIMASRHVHIESLTDGVDTITPVSWAGTEFIYTFRRGTDEYKFVSPWGNASVQIYENQSLEWSGTVNATGTEVVQDTDNANLVRIVSTIPILAHHVAGSNDAVPLYPASSGPLFGVATNWLLMASGLNGTNATINTSGAAQSVQPLPPGTANTSSGWGSQGTGPGMRVITDGAPIGVAAQADGNGNEMTTYLPQSQLSSRYGSSMAMNYLAIAAPVNGTNCTLYDGAGSPISSLLATGNSLVGKTGWGLGTASIFTGGGWIVECNNPVFAIADEAANDDESNLLGIRDMRQYHYPEPSVVLDNGSEERFETGIWNTGTTNISGFLYLAVQENSTGSWLTITPPVYQDLSEQTILPDAILNISQIWQASGGFLTGTRSPGWYRVYAALRDNDSNVLVDSDGRQMLDTGVFRIVEALLRLNNLTHENGYVIPLDEYEANDTINWINVTVQSLNNTAIAALIDLTLLNGTGQYPGWGPNSGGSCGNIAEGATCTLQWNNSGAGYVIPLSVPSGTYTFNWSVEMNSSNGQSEVNNSFTFQVHNTPSTFSSAISPIRIYTGQDNATYTFNFTNLWSLNLTNITVRLNFQGGVGLNASCSSGGIPTGDGACTLSNLAGAASFNFTVSANGTAVQGDYPLNVTLNYTNPGGETRIWTDQGQQLLEVREEGIIAITVTQSPPNITRGESGNISAFINNTADQNATNVTANYTIPSGWTNTSPLNALFAQLVPNETRWHNLSFNVTLAAALGGRQALMNTSSDQGQADFTIIAVNVYANTSVRNLSLNDTNASRGENVAIQATLRYDNGTPIAGQTLTFYDVTDSFSIGTGVTNGAGVASTNYAIPGGASLGLHTINISYNGSGALYTRPSSNVTQLDIGLQPVINALTETPDPQGQGSNVTITANVSDDDTIDSVLITIWAPNGSALVTNDAMTPSAGLYNYLFNQTWTNGTYTYTVTVNDTTGSTTTDNASFLIQTDAFLFLNTTQQSYGQNEDVFLAGNAHGWWWDRDWEFRQNITISELDGLNLSWVQVNLSLDTATLISSGKLNASCKDLRFILPTTQEIVSHYVENGCNTGATIVWLLLPALSGNVTVSLYYGNDAASSAEDTIDQIFNGTQYVGSDFLATSTLTIAGMYNDTEVCIGGVLCSTLNASDIWNVGSGNLSRNTTIVASKPVATAFQLADAGSPATPLAWMGRNFTFPASRGFQSIDVISPYLSANVSLIDSGGVRGSLLLGPGGDGEIEFDFADGNGVMLIANTSVVAHHEDEPGNNDYMPLYPGANGLYGTASSGNNIAELACSMNGTNLTVYASDGSVYTNLSCNQYSSMDLPQSSGGGVGPSFYAIANTSGIGGHFVADGDGTEGATWLPVEALDSYYVLPLDAEYITIVPHEPSTHCDLYDADGSPLGAQTSSAYAAPRPQDVIRFAASPVPAGASVVCNSTVWAYFESFSQNAETNLLGAKSWRTRGPTLPSISLGTEATYGSLISNTGSTALRGSLWLLVERNVSGSWILQATQLNDSVNGTIRTLQPGEALDLGSLWNATPWNTGNNPSGTYRAYSALVDPFGNILESVTQVLEDDALFNITPPPISLNLSFILVYDVTDTLNPHTYSLNLTANGTNTTFNFVSGRRYRVEFHVENGPNSTWNLTLPSLTHAGLNASWLINATADVWYENASDISERVGGTFNGTVAWNTSGNGGLAAPNTSVAFYYVLNLTGAAAQTLPVLFTIDDPLLQLTDNSIFEIALPDSDPPHLYQSVYNLTNNSILRGTNTIIYARWNESILNATASYNSTGAAQQNFSVSLPSPNTQNWTNHSINTTSIWYLGVHGAKLYARDLQGNLNATLQFLNFTVWGRAYLHASNLNASVINVTDLTLLSCTIRDTTNSSAIGDYQVSFYNSTGLLGMNTTNATGIARWTYQDFTPGDENLSCNITSNATTYHQLGSPAGATLLLQTLESNPPYPTNVSANTTLVYKGRNVSLRTFWHDDFQLSTAVLQTNATGTAQNVSSLPLTGTDAWANFTYTVPSGAVLGQMGWQQHANDSSNNTNSTALQTLDVWGLAIVESITLDPAFIGTGNSTNITCRVVDEANASGLQNYNVSFYNATDFIGVNQTNATGHARFTYTDFSSGVETMLCNITADPSVLYNVTAPSNATADLTTTDSGDTKPPRIVGSNYSLNTTSVTKGGSVLISALWDETINRSLVRLNRTSPAIEALNLSGPFTNNWTNYTMVTNSSWSVGTHVAKLEATDLANNTNTTLQFLSFNVTATSAISWISPPGGDVLPGSHTFVCLVSEEENGQPIQGYEVFFYNDTGHLLGTRFTNSSGHANLTYSTVDLRDDHDFSCRIFNAPTLFYSIGTNFQDSESFFFDADAPSVTLLSPPNGNLTDQLTINLSFITTDHDPLMACNVTLDSTIVASVNASNNTQVDVQQTPGLGNHTWNVTCLDNVGNTNTSATWNFTIFASDTTPPNVTLLAPAADAYLSNSTVLFSYNATDDETLDVCYLYIDGILNDTDSSPLQGGDNFTVPGIPDGGHTWFVSCEDAYGNQANSSVRIFTVDTVPPASFNLLAPGNGTVSTNATPLFSWEEVVELNFWNYTLQVSLSSVFLPGVTTEYVTFTQNDTSRQPLPLQMDRAYYWRVFASDRAFQETQSQQTYLYITDNSSPVVTLLSPPSGNNDPDGNVTLLFSVSDNAVANCSLYTNTSGTWQLNATNSTLIPGQSSFTLVGLPLGVNFTFIWNVLCYDPLGFSSFASANWSLRIGEFNETQGNETVPTNASVNNTLPRTDSVSIAGPVDLVAGGLQPLSCIANVSDDNGWDDILGANATLHHSTVTAGSPDNGTNHYTNASCGACTQFNSTTAECNCTFSLVHYAGDGVWNCTVYGIDAQGTGSPAVGQTTVNQLQALDVLPHLIDYGDVQGGIPSPEQNVSIVNLGNIPMDVSLWAYAVVPNDNLSFSCLNGANISVSAERFSQSSGAAYAAMTPLSGDPNAPAISTLSVPAQTAPPNSSLPLYWRLQSGSGVLGECNGTIVFQAEAS